MRISDWSSDVCSSDLVSLGAQNARYTDFSGPGYDYSGFRMASAPVLTVVAGLQQGFDLGSSGHLVGRVSAQYNSGFWSSYLHQGTFQRAFTRTDLSLTYTPDVGHWHVQAYVNNNENSEVFGGIGRSEEHTSDLQSLMRIPYAVFCLQNQTIHQPP